MAEKKDKWGKVGPPKSKKRAEWLKKISKIAIKKKREKANRKKKK